MTLLDLLTAVLFFVAAASLLIFVAIACSCYVGRKEPVRRIPIETPLFPISHTNAKPAAPDGQSRRPIDADNRSLAAESGGLSLT